jgi:transposase
MDPRKVLEAIVYVLRTGCKWEALPRSEFGSASSVHKHFLEWKKKGVFVKLWAKGLAEYDEMEGIARSWQSIDGAMVKAPMALEAVGPNPTDRGERWDEAKRARLRIWNPSVPRREPSPKAWRKAFGTDLRSYRSETASCEEGPEAISMYRQGPFRRTRLASDAKATLPSARSARKCGSESQEKQSALSDS